MAEKKDTDYEKEYMDLHITLVMRDAAITTVVVIGTVQLIKLGAGALAFVIISPVP